MKRWLCLALAALLLAGLALAEEPEARTEFRFRDDVTWSADEESVRMLEGDVDWETVETAGLARLCRLSGVSAAGANDVALSYAFVGRGLMQAEYQFPAGSATFDRLAEGLTMVYGDPFEPDEDRLDAIRIDLLGDADVAPHSSFANWVLEDGTYIALEETQAGLTLSYSDEAAIHAATPILPEDLAWGMSMEEALKAAGYSRWWFTETSGMTMLVFDNPIRARGPYPSLWFKDDALVMVTREFDPDDYGTVAELANMTALYDDLYGPHNSEGDEALAPLVAAMTALTGEEVPPEPEGGCAGWTLSDGTRLALTDRFEDAAPWLVAWGEDVLAELTAPTPEPVSTDGL